MKETGKQKACGTFGVTAYGRMACDDRRLRAMQRWGERAILARMVGRKTQRAQDIVRWRWLCAPVLSRSVVWFAHAPLRRFAERPFAVRQTPTRAPLSGYNLRFQEDA